MNLVLLLDRLDQMIQQAPAIPLTGKSLVDAEAVLDLLDKVRNALPDEVRQAEAVASAKERLIKEGESEAQRLIEEAEKYVAKMVQESEIVRRAQEEGERILAESRAEADILRKEADEYAARVLEQLQEALEKTLETVREGRGKLQEG